MTRFPPHIQGLILATLGALCLTPDALLVRLSSTHEWNVVFWRGLLSGCMLILIQVFRQKPLSSLVPRTHKEGLAALLSTLGITSFVMSILYTSAANALVILSTMSLFAALLSMIFLKERIARRTWIAMGFAFLGIVVVFFDGLTGEGLLGMIIALGCALVTSANMTVFRSDPTINVPVVFAWGGFGAALLSLFMTQDLAIGIMDSSILSAMAAASALAFVLLGSGAKLIPAPEVALLMLLETILGPIWVWLVLAEAPSTYALIGGAIVIITLAAHSFAALKKRPD